MLVTDHSEHFIIAASSVLTTATIQRFLAYVAHALPPLDPKAGWWATFAYNLLGGMTGIDPSSTTISQTAMSALPASVSKQIAATAQSEK